MKAVWDPAARHRLTTRATMDQLIRWGREASRQGVSTAQLVAQGADFYAIYLKTLREYHTPEEERPWS